MRKDKEIENRRWDGENSSGLMTEMMPEIYIKVAKGKKKQDFGKNSKQINSLLPVWKTRVTSSYKKETEGQRESLC